MEGHEARQLRKGVAMGASGGPWNNFQPLENFKLLVIHFKASRLLENISASPRKLSRPLQYLFLLRAGSYTSDIFKRKYKQVFK